MTQIDYVTTGIIVSQEAKFNLDDFYSVMKKWCSNHRYLIKEKEYADKGNGNFYIRWETRKEVYDYNAFEIDLTIRGKNIQKIDDSKEGLVEGKIEVEFESFMESDYHQKWSEPIRQFLRDVYDKFIRGNKTEEIKQELIDETYDLVNKTRSYLRQHAF